MINNLVLAGTVFNELSDTYQVNTPLGVVIIRAGEDRCWINSSLVTADSVILANLNSLDATAKSAHATEQTDGSFVIRLDTNATEDVRVGFLVTTLE